MSVRVVLDLVEAVARVPYGGTLTVPAETNEVARTAARWCEQAGHTFVSWYGDHVEVRRGVGRDPFADLPDDKRPGRRLWLYTNFDCNLACGYCCVSSSPRTPRRALGIDLVRRIAAEAPSVGARELFITGGEPFMLPDIAEILTLCSRTLPTVVLTNGTLFRGPRLALLDSLPRHQLALQVSLDSATPSLHDRQRGEGTHGRALAGIETALRLGFRVRVAATVASGQAEEERALHHLCDALGVVPVDRVIRRIAHQGAAEDGLIVTRESLVPEVCLTADGVYWHPVAATDPTMLVTPRVLPLAAAVAAVTVEFADYRRRAGEVALSFPCA